MPIALPFAAFDAVVIVLWAIAAALAIALIMAKIGDVFNGVPVVGPPIAKATHAVAKAVTNACGALMQGIEGLIGAGLHLLARYLDKYFEQFVLHASVIAHLARIVGGELYKVTGLKALVHQLEHAVHVVLHRFTAIGRELYNLRHRVKRLEHDVAQGIGDDVLPRIKSLDRRLHHLADEVVPELEAAEAQAESAIADLRAWISRTIPIPGTEAFAAAIAVALAALGLGGLRCNSLLGALKRRGCGLWSGLEDLLGLIVDAVIFVDLCHLLPELEQLFGIVEAPLVELIASAADAACAHPPAGFVELEAPALVLPQVYYSGPAIGG